MIPPRSSSLNNSSCTFVFRYTSALLHWRPPVNQTAVAFFSGSTNESVFATFESLVCKTVTSLKPLFLNCLFIIENVGSDFIEFSLQEVGITTTFEFSPPPYLLNISHNSSVIPPPPISNVPFSGPDVLLIFSGDLVFLLLQENIVKIVKRSIKIVKLFIFIHKSPSFCFRIDKTTQLFLFRNIIPLSPPWTAGSSLKQFSQNRNCL